MLRGHFLWSERPGKISALFTVGVKARGTKKCRFSTLDDNIYIQGLGTPYTGVRYTQDRGYVHPIQGLGTPYTVFRYTLYRG
jgi:hypothetical protein